MENNKEAMEYLVNLGVEKDPIVKLEQGTFSKIDLNRVNEPRAAVIKVSTLTGLVDYVKTNIDKLESKLLIQVKSPNEVRLYGPLNQDREREQFISAEAIIPDNVVYERFIEVERFNIMLQSSFVSNTDIVVNLLSL